MQEPKLLTEMLAEHLEQKGYSAEKLAAITSVPERFVATLLNGEYKSLPAAPYLRGYLKKIAQVLEIDPNEMWRLYEKENAPHSSGEKDYLPGNRFAIQHISKKNAILAVISGLLILYAGINADRLLGKPKLTITNPSSENISLTMPFVVLQGKLENPKDLITINSVTVNIDDSGEFQKEFTLDLGANTFEIIAKRFLGRETRIIRQITYEPPALQITPPLQSQ